MAPDVTTFDLPFGFEHWSFYGSSTSNTLTEKYGINIEKDTRREDNWIVKLGFTKLGKKSKRPCP
jgi:hypothetical protein